jgi:hypothetical protein
VGPIKVNKTARIPFIAHFLLLSRLGHAHKRVMVSS